MKKTIYLLDIDDYAPRIKEITMPYIEAWADKIKAEIFVIKERRFPTYPVVYEKLQIYELAKQHKNDWNIYIDLDTLVHPDFFDITALLNKDTVLQFQNDFSLNRIRIPNKYMLRDGRFIGTCNWFTVFSDWCIDLFKPIESLSCEEIITNLKLTRKEELSGNMDDSHLIDDFVLTNNLAKYGIKYKTMAKLFEEKKIEGEYLVHTHLYDNDKKIVFLNDFKSHWIGENNLA